MELREAFSLGGDRPGGDPDRSGAGTGRTLAVVGAGGKKTTLYRLARACGRAVVTSTVRIPIFDDEVAAVRVTRDPVGALGAALDGEGAWPLGLVPEQERSDRYRGYDRETVTDLAATAREGGVPVLVKADGARTRWLKAPNDREPQVPPGADVVVPIASVRVVGEPLDEEHVHRPGRVGAITGLSEGDRIGTDDVAALLADPNGGLKDVPDGARVVALLNMVDDEALAATAREIAAGVLDRAGGPTDTEPAVDGTRSTVDRVVLARMAAEDSIVDVVEP